MNVLEQVSELKNQGLPESEIISRLRQAGVSPRKINDALGQFQIKNAVYSQGQQGNQMPPAPMPSDEKATEPAYVPKTQEMDGQQEAYAPQPQEQYSPPQEVYQEYPQQEQYYPQESYPSENTSADTMIEIAEQVFAEEIKKVEKKIDKITDTQNILQTKVEYSETRLKKIESIIEKLEVAILERIGSYGHSLETIKKEMAMVEDSFSKIIPHAKAHHKKTSSHGSSSSHRGSSSHGSSSSHGAGGRDTASHKKTTHKKTSKKK